MSKIKNDGLDQYGKVYSFNGIGGEGVNGVPDYDGSTGTVRLAEVRHVHQEGKS